MVRGKLYGTGRVTILYDRVGPTKLSYGAIINPGVLLTGIPLILAAYWLARYKINAASPVQTSERRKFHRRRVRSARTSGSCELGRAANALCSSTYVMALPKSLTLMPSCEPRSKMWAGKRCSSMWRLTGIDKRYSPGKWSDYKKLLPMLLLLIPIVPSLSYMLSLSCVLYWSAPLPGLPVPSPIAFWQFHNRGKKMQDEDGPNEVTSKQFNWRRTKKPCALLRYSLSSSSSSL